MKRPKMLSATFVRTVNVPGRYGDGRGGFGLSLLVRPASRGGFAKCWTQSVRIDGKPTSIGLGRYPVVTLAMARERAIENARSIVQGDDPRRRSKVSVPTFENAVEAVIAIHCGNWKDGGKTKHQWCASLSAYAFPRLGNMPVNTIVPADVMDVLLPIWTTKRETARRVRRRIGAVMKWAVAQGYRTDNPAGDAIGGALPTNNVPPNHQLALPHAKVGAALRRVRDSGAYRGTVLSFEFLVLTACRSGEVRNALWDEIDLDAAVWTIPAERMKTQRVHRVPLSSRTLSVLGEAQRELGHGGDIVFPSPTGLLPRHHAMGALLRELEIGAVPHGFRSSFRDWAAERTEAPREVCELALAHVNNDRVEAAYRRSDLFDRRRELMQQWDDYIASQD